MQTEIQESNSAGRLALTVKETALRMGISNPTAYEGVRNGSIPSIKIGRRILVPIAALERMFGAVSK